MAFSQQANDSTQMWQISTNDGNNFIGFIISESTTQITFKTFSYGQIQIPRVIVVSQKMVGSQADLKKKKKQIKNAIPPSELNSETIWHVVTNEGYDFVGTIISKNEQFIELKTLKFGVVQIQQVTIKSLKIITPNQIIKGDAWFENPQGSRYFYTPNGYGLQKKEGYYQNVWVLFNQISYGFSDYFTMGVGTVPTILFGADVLPVWVTPKFSFPIIKDKFNIGAGVFAGRIIGESQGFGLVYGVATYGNRDKNINIGAGYLYADGDWAKKPTYSISTMLRVSKKGYLISENFIIRGNNETTVLLSLGGRTIWPRLSIDYGFVIPIIEEFNNFVAIPWLGFVIPISNY
jgi:hypothetical protein